MTKKNKHQKSYYKGLWAERLSALWLFVKGYRIIKMRYKTKVGEIDIIAKRGNTIAFIEVKAHTTMDKGVTAISNISKGRIFKAAEFFLAKNPKWSGMELRFDAMMVHHCFLITHLSNAWNENDCYFK